MIDSGSTEFLPGVLVDRAVFEAENRRWSPRAASLPPAVRC